MFTQYIETFGISNLHKYKLILTSTEKPLKGNTWKVYKSTDWSLDIAAICNENFNNLDVKQNNTVRNLWNIKAEIEQDLFYSYEPRQTWQPMDRAAVRTGPPNACLIYSGQWGEETRQKLARRKRSTIHREQQNCRDKAKLKH